MIDKPIVYIAGKYTGKSKYRIIRYLQTRKNIKKAEKIARIFWKNDYAVICPHLNSAYMGNCNTYKHFIDSYLSIIGRLNPDRDSVFMLTGWQQSRGACLEREYAKQLKLFVYYEDNGDLVNEGAI